MKKHKPWQPEICYVLQYLVSMSKFIIFVKKYKIGIYKKTQDFYSLAAYRLVFYWH